MGDSMGSPPAKLRRFVIHEHYARSHHFDLRLECGGSLWSWAVPKGMPTDATRNRLAVRVDDHDLDHIDFEDLSPVTGAGPGVVRKSIWDQGRYRTVRSSPDKLVIDIAGERISGRYAIFRTDGNNWLIHLMD